MCEAVAVAVGLLRNQGDEVRITLHDYRLCSAAVALNGGVVRQYPCPPEKSFAPDIAALEAMVTPRTRALVIINPNNPTGAVYDRELLEQMVALAEQPTW